MYPAQFEYHTPGTVKEALDLLGRHKDDAKLLAGGHSLLPAMKLRLAQPKHLVDLRKISGLAGIKEEAIAKAFDDTLTGFATTRFGDYAPARRALEAELVDLAEPLHDALRLLEDAGVAARGAPRDQHAYRQWYARLRDTFEAADRAWLALDAALDSATRS